MKAKKVIASLLIATMFCITGCSPQTPYQMSTQNANINKYSNEVDFTKARYIQADGLDDRTVTEYIDGETGVHYFYTFYGGLTPRYNADGSLMTD